MHKYDDDAPYTGPFILWGPWALVMGFIAGVLWLWGAK